jgi:hypoxanthine-DNA glycosylase
VEILILGSFPSIASLGKAQYYGHPQNHFWRLVGAVIGEPLPEMDYQQRLRTLLKHRIGLWDILGECARAGSLDSNIRDPRHNDFSRVISVAKKLRRVCFNGKTAGKMQPLFAEQGFETIVLPSSSPANTLRFELKLLQWRQIVAIERAPRPPAHATNVQSVGLAFPASRHTPHASRQKC